jgi:hypothetical protein
MKFTKLLPRLLCVVVMTVGQGDETAMKLQGAKDALRFGDTPLLENITLPETGLFGARISWESSDNHILSVNKIDNSRIGYDNGPPGIITRRAADQPVTLTATLSLGDQSVQKAFPLVVRAEEPFVFGGYFYAYFRGRVEGKEEVQQIHIASSPDGPEIFKLYAQNGGPDHWCLMLDQYAANGNPGFIPFVTGDLEGGQFERMEAVMPSGAKHGAVIAVSPDEYAAIRKKWAPLQDSSR